VLMALDHVRDYFSNAHFNLLDLSQTTVPLFLTRWITHFCAPTFIFLAGVSAHLMSTRCTKPELARFLFTRGVWLIVLEVTVILWAWSFNFDYSKGVFLQVIWAIGVSMIALAGLIMLSRRAIASIAIVMIAGHNLLDGIQPSVFGAWAPLWNLLHVQGPFPVGFVAYPLIPWIGVMALGYVMGSLYDRNPLERRRVLLTLGTVALTVFIVLRLTTSYGDPHRWQAQDTVVHSLLAFIDVAKYPPSLLYLLVTLGTSWLLLGAFDGATGAFMRVLRTYGRVPLFFYVLHIVLAHLLAGIAGLATGFGTSVLTNAFMFLPREWGFSLPVVYLAWITVLVMLYPACKWFAGVKRRRRDWWLSYL
jgi:uncharacterized membrane protein